MNFPRIRTLTILSASLAVGLLAVPQTATASLISVSAPVSAEFAGTPTALAFSGGLSGYPIEVTGFDSTLGTLDSVELSITLTVDTTSFLLNTVQIDNGVELVPLAIPVNAQVTDGPIELAVGGFPVYTGAIQSLPGSSVATPFSLSPVTTQATASTTVHVPQFEFSNFDSPLVTLDLSDLEVGTIQPLLTGDVGSLILVNELSQLQGTVQVTYDYTPTPVVPEPSFVPLLISGCLALAGWRFFASRRPANY